MINISLIVLLLDINRCWRKTAKMFSENILSKKKMNLSMPKPSTKQSVNNLNRCTKRLFVVRSWPPMNVEQHLFISTLLLIRGEHTFHAHNIGTINSPVSSTCTRFYVSRLFATRLFSDLSALTRSAAKTIVSRARGRLAGNLKRAPAGPWQNGHFFALNDTRPRPSVYTVPD